MAQDSLAPLSLKENPPSEKLPSAFEKALSERSDIYTSEIIVEIGGRKFRKIAYRGKNIYLELLSEKASTTDLVYLCSDEGAKKFNNDSPPLITGAMRVTKRSRLFIEGLKNICSGKPEQPRIEPSSALLVGFMMDDSEDPKAILKNRKIFINPVHPSFGFRADW